MIEKRYTIRKLLNDVLGCSKAIDIDAPIQFSIVENLNMNDETEETLKPIGVFFSSGKCLSNISNAPSINCLVILIFSSISDLDYIYGQNHPAPCSL